MKEIIFEKIKARIVARVPEIKTFGLFNNQFNTEKQVNAFTYPAMFVEFGSIDWKTQQRRIQVGNCKIMFHVGVETLKTDSFANRIDKPSTDLEILLLLKKIHTAIQGFDDELFTPLARVDEQQNTDHDGVLSWIVSYSSQLSDDGAEIITSKPLVVKNPPIDLVVDPILIL